MAIHRIQTGDMVVYTGDAGLDELDNAFRDELKKEIERLKEIERRQELYKYIDEDRRKRREVMVSFIKSLKK